MINGFKEFIMRGNVLDLAIAVVIGSAFTAIVNAVVTGVITPLIAALFGEPTLKHVGNFEINGARFQLGLVLDGILQFLLVAAAVYFLLVMPLKKIKEYQDRLKAEHAAAQQAVAEHADEQTVLLREIRDALVSEPRR